eukprot:644741-Rhodomonas_salina.4
MHDDVCRWPRTAAVFRYARAPTVSVRDLQKYMVHLYQLPANRIDHAMWEVCDPHCEIKQQATAAPVQSVAGMQLLAFDFAVHSRCSTHASIGMGC